MGHAFCGVCASEPCTCPSVEGTFASIRRAGYEDGYAQARAQALEEAARRAEKWGVDEGQEPWAADLAGLSVADAIRALKEAPASTEPAG